MSPLVEHGPASYEEKLTIDWKNLSGLAYTPLRYFYLAEIQIQSSATALEKE